MIRLLREPLVHFLLIGASMFAIYAWRSGADSEPTREQIVVTAGRIKQLNVIFQKTWQRPPTSAEMKGLIDEFVLEEAYYRKAVAIGIDRDDTVIRRRLRQKLEFLTDDAAALVSATDEDLAAYLAEHADTFRESPKYSFRQVYFNPDRHADKDATWFADQVERLRAGESEIGDPSLIAESFVDAPRQAVDGSFGTGFSTSLDELELETWQGPIRSGIGLHLILLENRVEGRLPSLDEIRPIVEREWSNVQRIANRKAMDAELLKAYEVVIEWPQQEVAGSADTVAGPERPPGES